MHEVPLLMLYLVSRVYIASMRCEHKRSNREAILAPT